MKKIDVPHKFLHSKPDLAACLRGTHEYALRQLGEAVGNLRANILIALHWPRIPLVYTAEDWINAQVEELWPYVNKGNK